MLDDEFKPLGLSELETMSTEALVAYAQAYFEYDGLNTWGVPSYVTTKEVEDAALRVGVLALLGHTESSEGTNFAEERSWMFSMAGEFERLMERD